MTAPAGFLVVALAGLVLAVLLFWPPRGLWWRWRAGAAAGERVLVEDALKHLFGFEEADREATLESVAGALGVDRNRAAEILQRLQSEDLAAPREGRWRLSPEGRTYALRVLRTHRLWERYFSDETGLPPGEWHVEAERREHSTTAAQVEALAASLGNPLFDPHGDPIPTADGGLPEALPDIPLTLLPPGKVAEIVHVEDEPAAVYAQLVAEGLHPGVRVRILETAAAKIRLEADAEERILAPIVANNVTVRVRSDVAMPPSWERLSGLEPGTMVRVLGLSPALRGAERRRLLDLGLVAGTRVEVVRRAPGGDPTAYRVRGAMVALRRRQADEVRVERLADAGEAA